jgi:hypothetical protein
VTEDIVAEVHHIIPVIDFNQTAWVASREAPEDKQKYWFDKFRIMLQLDMNNLILLCRHPCHDEAHNHINNQIRKNNGNILDNYTQRDLPETRPMRSHTSHPLRLGVNTRQLMDNV